MKKQQKQKEEVCCSDCLVNFRTDKNTVEEAKAILENHKCVILVGDENDEV